VLERRCEMLLTLPSLHDTTPKPRVWTRKLLADWTFSLRIHSPIVTSL
jgi:hypothetical protein